MPKKKLQDRFAAFARGERAQLVEASLDWSQMKAQSATRRRRREQKDELSRLAERALGFVQMGELSTARQALEGARLAPGNDETLQVLRDPEKRPPLLRETLSEAVRSADPDPFELDGELFLQCVRSSRRGVAGGPSGMTADHLQPILEMVVMQRLSCRSQRRWRKGRFRRKHWMESGWVGSQH